MTGESHPEPDRSLIDAPVQEFIRQGKGVGQFLHDIGA